MNLKFYHNLTLAILITIFLSACNTDVSNSCKSTPKETDDFQGVYLPTDIMGKIILATEINYIPDPKGTDSWQTPAETLKRKAGDCEDIAILLQHEFAKLNFKSEVVFGLKTRLDKHGHAWCEFNYEGSKYIIEPGNGVCYDRKKINKLRYIPVNKLPLVGKKILNYYKKTGVWINSNYKNWILTELK